LKYFNLFSPRIFIYYFKQFWFIRKFKGRLISKGYRLSLEPLAQIHIDSNSQISFGKNAHLLKNVDIHAYDGAHIVIGDNFLINKNASIIARYGITIGNNCMIAENTTITDHNHAFHDPSVPFASQGYTGAEIIIGNNVWISGRVFIGQGVHIGDNVVIGANTIVTKSIPSDSIVYGKTELVIKPRQITSEKEQ
jgi:galactoside O-acetyltransferase/maltose O-acetyltransferase